LRSNSFYSLEVARIIKAPLAADSYLTTYFCLVPLKPNLHSPERRLIELRMEHGDLDALIDQAAFNVPKDELMMRRLKKKRLSLRDEIARVEREIDPNESA
jgi:hypothetical protein